MEKRSCKPGFFFPSLLFSQRESVELALKLLDEKEIRGYKLHVEVAQFQLKGEYDASKKKKKCKDYKKKLSQQQKYVAVKIPQKL